MIYYSPEKKIKKEECGKIKRITNIVNFDEPRYIDEIGMEAYGYLVSKQKVSDETAASCGLVCCRKKKYYEVVSSYFDDGSIETHIGGIVSLEERPKMWSVDKGRYDVYHDYVESLGQANKLMALILKGE